MTVRIPNQGKWNQPNRGEIFGNLSRTQNIDLQTSPGKLKISSRLTPILRDNDASITGMGVPIAFGVLEQSAYKYVAVTGIGTGLGTSGTGRVFVSDDSSFTSDWDNEGSGSTPTDIHLGFSDAVIWRERLYVTTYVSSAANALMKELNNTTWDANFLDTRGTTDFKTQGGIKNLCPAFNGNLYFTDDDEVGYIPPSGNAVQSGSGSLDFQGVYRPIWIRSSSDRLWIGLMTKDDSTGSKGYVAEWYGTGTAPNKIYDIDAPCALSCCIFEDVPYIIDAYGKLKKLWGAGFREVARLPVANQNIEMPGIYDDLNNSRWIHHRGLEVVNGQICVNVNNFVSTGVYVEDMPSGVWAYDPDIGLYHKNAPTATSDDYGQSLIKTSGALFGTRRAVGNYLAGFSYYTDDATTARNGVFYDDVATDTNKRGIFTTPFVSSDKIEDVWQSVSYRFRAIPSGDKIIGKYRNGKKANLPFIASHTWTSTTTLTSTDPDFQYASVGDEVEVMMGKGASTTAHISAISEAGGTYTVTLEEAIGFSSGTGKVKVDNFRKIAAITQQDTNQETLPIGTAGTKAQIKTEIRATGAFELEDITLISTSHKLLQ